MIPFSYQKMAEFVDALTLHLTESWVAKHAREYSDRLRLGYEF